VVAQWTFGDGQTGSGLSTTHRWTSAQRFQVAVQARFPNGRTGVASITVQVVAQPVGTVVVNISNPGGGTVTSQPAGLNCPPTCATGFPIGTALTLAAAAAVNFTFGGWAGACTGPTCQFTVAAGQTGVTATFTPVPRTTATLTIRITGTGSGRITGRAQTAAVNCTATCSIDFKIGTRVNVFQAPSSLNSRFGGWDRDCGNGSDDQCLFDLTTDTTVTVSYEHVWLLNITTAVTGGGDLTKCCGVVQAGGGGTCLVSCTEQPFSPGTSVTMTAVPQDSEVFDHWSGDCSGTQPSCTLTMTKDMNVRANFRAG
jgi:hypothetical protein